MPKINPFRGHAAGPGGQMRQGGENLWEPAFLGPLLPYNAPSAEISLR